MTLSEDSLDTCKNILNVAKMHSKSIWLIRQHGGRDIRGDKDCYTGKSCLKTILLHEIDDYCRVCSTTACYFMLAWR